MQPVQNTMQNDARPSAKAIHGHVAASDNLMENVGTQYNKGKMVLGMFEQWMGAEKFQHGVRQYLKQHAWGNATADDLWHALSAASSREFTGAMKTFLDQPGLPLVTAELGAGGRVTLRQQRFLNFGVEAPAQSWRIPIVLRYADARGVKTQSVLLDTAERSVQLRAEGTVAWVLPNADARGFYRWRVPAEQLAVLSNTARAQMSPRERIGLVHNMTALLNNGGVHGDDYLRALQAFGGDPEPLVVGAVASALSGIRTAFVPESAEHAFAAYVRRTLGPALERIGMDKQPGEKETTAGVRAQLMDWLGDEGRDEAVLAHAQKLAQQYLDDAASVDPSLASVVVKLAAHRGSRPLYDTYRTRFEDAKIPAERTRFLAAMGNFRDAAILEEALAYAITGPLRPQELFVVLQGLGETAPGRDRSWRWMTENFDLLAKRLPPESVGFMPFFASGCEAERVAAAREFFGDPAHQAPGTQTSIARVSDAVADCVRLREREGAAAVAFLHEQVGVR
jgi:alanyl aminopeptidase